MEFLTFMIKRLVRTVCVCVCKFKFWK